MSEQHPDPEPLKVTPPESDHIERGDKNEGERR